MSLEVSEVGGGRSDDRLRRRQASVAASPDLLDDSDSEAPPDRAAGAGRHGQAVGLAGQEADRRDRALPEVEPGRGSGAR